MASRVDLKVTLANFREFDKLNSENSKMILTCRTHYFKNQDEIHKLHEGTEIYKKIDEKGGYALLFLNPFKEDDFVIYLKKFFPENWRKYYRTIVITYNLRGLAEKPILLELMVETLPQIKIEVNEKLNHALLYERYTNFWLQRDDWRSYLKSNEREFITEEIALYLFNNDKDKIFYEELPKLIQERFPSKRSFEIEYLDQDVRTCTFLNRDDSGNYSFVHQSFMEFFVAKKFASEIKSNDSTNFRLKKLSPEIAGFLMNLIDKGEVKTFYEFIEFTKMKSFDEVKYLGGNSATILNLLGTSFSGMDMSSTVLTGANFNNANLVKSNLSNTLFSIADVLDGIDLEELTRLNRMNMRKLIKIGTILKMRSNLKELEKTDEFLKINKELSKLKKSAKLIKKERYSELILSFELQKLAKGLNEFEKNSEPFRVSRNLNDFENSVELLGMLRNLDLNTYNKIEKILYVVDNMDSSYSINKPLD